MVWLADGIGGRSSSVFIKGKQNHKDYVQQLEAEFLPYRSDCRGENWIYQRDGSSIRTFQRVNGLITIMFKFCSGQLKVQTSMLSKMFGLG